MDLTQLAVLCQKVAESPTASSTAAHQGRKMKQEWTLLIQATTPPLPDLKYQNTREAEMERLKRRMVQLAVRCFALTHWNALIGGGVVFATPQKHGTSERALDSRMLQ